MVESTDFMWLAFNRSVIRFASSSVSDAPVYFCLPSDEFIVPIHDLFDAFWYFLDAFSDLFWPQNTPFPAKKKYEILINQPFGRLEYPLQGCVDFHVTWMSQHGKAGLIAIRQLVHFIGELMEVQQTAA